MVIIIKTNIVHTVFRMVIFSRSDPMQPKKAKVNMIQPIIKKMLAGSINHGKDFPILPRDFSVLAYAPTPIINAPII